MKRCFIIIPEIWEKAWNDAHDTSDGKSPKENGRMEEIARRIVMFGVRKGN